MTFNLQEIGPMHKICAGLHFPQCATYAQDLRKIVLFPNAHIWARFAQDCTYFFSAQYMRRICARLYLFNQCAKFAQDCTYFSNAQYMRKICARLYLFLQCARFAQDCTSPPNVQYMHKIAGIIGRDMSHITYLLGIYNGMHFIVIFGLPQALTSF